jgi:hypothetical protein
MTVKCICGLLIIDCQVTECPRCGNPELIEKGCVIVVNGETVCVP